MKKVILTAGLAFLVSVAFAQKTADDYIVRTKNAVKKNATAEVAEGVDSVAEKKTAHDFISENFKFQSLCDWEEGMRFMVLPEKYDLIVNTFHDASDREVSSVTLRRKIMVYKGRTEGADGHARMNFHCQDNGQNYYFEIPSGRFEDYCYGKLGVPTLAYLGDVDIAYEKLLGKKVYTTAKIYYIDTDYDSDGAQEVEVPEREEVKIVAVGVGTRSFPVKIIVENKNGKQYYQNVAISKTNSGLRDDEFIMDNTRHLFAGSFELEEDIMLLSDNYRDYIGKDVHTKYRTKMLNEKETKERNIISQTGFKIMDIRPKAQEGYVTLTLKELNTAGIFFKDVKFASESILGDVSNDGDELFGKLFALGPGKQIETSSATRTAIREGRVTIGMNEDEVLMVMGDPVTESTNKTGNKEWRFKTSSGKTLVVTFGRDGKVRSAEVDRTPAKRTTNTRRTGTGARRTTAKR